MKKTTMVKGGRKLRSSTSMFLVLAVVCQAVCAFFPLAQNVPVANASTASASANNNIRLVLAGNWYSSSYQYRQAVAIDNTANMNALTNYQIRLTVPYDPAMKADFSDIRFTDSDGVTLMNYWIETYAPGSSATVWIKVPSVASASRKTVYMYFGNSSAVSGSNGNGVFDYFGDYEPSKMVLRFAAASDGHYGEEDTDYQTNFQNIVKWLNNEKASKGLDYSFFVGDSAMGAGYLSTVKNVFGSLTMPYKVVNGNHDTATSSVWQSIWGYTRNTDFSSGDFAFITVNTADEKGNVFCADSTWLSQRLDYYANKKYVFIFMHVTPSTWTYNGIDCPDVRRVIASHKNVGGVFNGHDHQEDGTKFTNNTNYAFDGRFGGDFGVSYDGYRITEVYEDGSIYTYQYNPQTGVKVNEDRFGFSKGYTNPTEVVSYSSARSQHGTQSLKISGTKGAYAVYSTKSMPADKYVLESWVSGDITAYSALGIGLVNATTANPQSAYGNYIQSTLYSSNLLNADVVMDSIRSRTSSAQSTSSGAWYKLKIVLDGKNALFYGPNGNLMKTAAYDPAKLFPAFPEFRQEADAASYYDMYLIHKYSPIEPTTSFAVKTLNL